MNDDKENLFELGVKRARAFCELNAIPMPTVRRLTRNDRLYHLATCAYYRPAEGIVIMVEKCAHRGFGGRAWSWPGYAIDRTPFGVVQHELGHHVDNHFFKDLPELAGVFSKRLFDESKEEAPLTGYLGNYGNYQRVHFYMEWFAENFRLFVTNPDFSKAIRPRFYAAAIGSGLKPLPSDTWEKQLLAFDAPFRIVEQARKKVAAAAPDLPAAVGIAADKVQLLLGEEGEK